MWFGWSRVSIGRMRGVAVSDGVAWDIASLSRVSRSAFTVIHNPVRPFAGAGAGAVDRARGDEFWSGPCGGAKTDTYSLEA